VVYYMELEENTSILLVLLEKLNLIAIPNSINTQVFFKVQTKVLWDYHLLLSLLLMENSLLLPVWVWNS
jgi:hypothetical protein